MGKYQLFRIVPPKVFVETIIKLYGPNGFDEHYYFTLKELEQNNIIEQINNNIDLLKQYYMECKWNYITNLTLKKTITILRQLIRPYNYKIISTEKYKNGNKFLLYNIKQLDNNIKDKTLTMNFD